MFWKKEYIIWILGFVMTLGCICACLFTIEISKNNLLYREVAILKENLSGDEIDKLIADRAASNENVKTLQNIGKTYLDDRGYSPGIIRYLEFKHFWIPILVPFTIAMGMTWILIIYLLQRNALHRQREKEILVEWIDNLSIDADNKYKRPLLENADSSDLQEAIWRLYNRYRRRRRELMLRYEQSVTFMENVSHQILTPATSLGLNLSVLEEDAENPETVAKLRICSRQCSKIDTLTRTLLQIAKLDRGEAGYNFKSKDLNTLMKKIEEDNQLLNPDTCLNVLYSNETIIVAYDEKWLKEAIENIIRNCFLYSQIEEPVILTLSIDDVYARIVIEDEGIGVQEKDFPHLFERFYRSETNQFQHGFGIGLNMAKMVVEAHHGEIMAKRKQKGTIFIIKLRYK
ncbi:HAMP domain-containing sensor histidine kinase [Anaerolentibacter hominis]|uniref:sensor histidine kinase n=1 Tax=Anaerolentibacter hominis TaxID=3079009 RepID=UPI0031B8A80D